MLNNNEKEISIHTYFRLSTRTVLIGLAVILVGCLAVYFSKQAITGWTNEVIESNKRLCLAAADQLHDSALDFIDSLHQASVFNRSTLTELQADKVDSVLKSISTSVLTNYDRVEGGFYFTGIEKFIGYDFPTSPPPKPVFGPPPRSHEMILKQVNATIAGKHLLMGLHQFDPAIFPLVTKPVFFKNQVIGAVWSRIHIERELPSEKLKKTFNLTAITAIAAFLLVVIITIRFQRRLNEIRAGIERIEKEPTYKIRNMPGVFGSIGQYVNKMVAALSAEHQRRRELEKELLQKEKMATLGRLVSGVAHEVKTPLAIIKTRVQMWQQELKRVEKDSPLNDIISTDSIQLIVSEIDRLARLVRRLLYFSKPVSARFAPADINQVLSHSITMTQINHNIAFDTDFEQSIPPINCDSPALEQVFLNLLANACEAMPEGGSVLIKTWSNKSEGTVSASFSDNGPGIPADILSKIFDPFFTTKNNGVGLGLSICYEIVAAHNGKLTYANNLNSGAVFTVVLPIAGSGKPDKL